MANYEYRGLTAAIPDNDSEYKGYFEAASGHKLVVKRCTDCGLSRGDPGPACPWCSSMQWDWREVSGKGTIYSYQIVNHAVLPGFKDWTPFPIVLVELEEQSGTPEEGDGLRITTNLLKDSMEPEDEANVAIGKAVEVIFQDVGNGLTLPQFKLSDTQQPSGPIWRHS